MKLRRLLIGTAVVALVLAAATRWVLSWPTFGAPLSGERLARAQANPQYRDGAFVNPLPPAGYTLADVRLLIGGMFGDEQRVPPAPIPVLTPSAAELAPRAGPALRAFWLGHGGAYIEIDGARLLVDPVFADYASPFEFGPKRFHPPPLALAALPKIDVVLITHDHYDHLDMTAVQALARRGTHFCVPLGIGAHLAAWGVPEAQIHDLAWWQEHALPNGVRIVSTPSRHYSGRGLADKDATLWGSWTVLGARHRVYVSGDTGYSDHFKTIASRFGPFDLAIVKIGAYGPGQPWIDIHMSAEDAVRAARELGAKRMFPVHWGTFNLAYHAWDEPIRRAAAAALVEKVELLTPRVGEFVDADAPFTSTRWWEAVR